MRPKKPRQGYPISSPEVARHALRFILKHVEENGFAPNVREVGACVGYTSSSTAHLLIQHLIENGYVEMNPKIARSIRATKEGKKLATKKLTAARP